MLWLIHLHPLSCLACKLQPNTTSRCGTSPGPPHKFQRFSVDTQAHGPEPWLHHRITGVVILTLSVWPVPYFYSKHSSWGRLSSTTSDGGLPYLTTLTALLPSSDQKVKSTSSSEHLTPQLWLILKRQWESWVIVHSILFLFIVSYLCFICQLILRILCAFIYRN